MMIWDFDNKMTIKEKKLEKIPQAIFYFVPILWLNIDTNLHINGKRFTHAWHKTRPTMTTKFNTHVAGLCKI